MHDTHDAAFLLLREEYPNVSLSGDTDIERYYELRKDGRLADALSLYNGKLRKKYPDDSMRERLMRSYRSRDPNFRVILEQSVAELAQRALKKTTAIINFLTRDIDTVNLTDAYAVIKLAEGLLAVISPDRYTAIAITERYARLARILNWKADAMERTAELIRLYVTDTIDSVLAFRKNAEEKRKRNMERAVRQRHRKAGLDLSNISFSEEDVRRILIPRAITGTEDTVIAYCLKYWNLTSDPAFEKTVLLYSRKFHTRHYEIFAAIKNGRDHDWRDEEILNAVLANVVTGYYYSISGDLYLQRTWARYKANLGGPAGSGAGSLAADGQQTAQTGISAPTSASAPGNQTAAQASQSAAAPALDPAEAAEAKAKTRRVQPARKSEKHGAGGSGNSDKSGAHKPQNQLKSRKPRTSKREDRAALHRRPGVKTALPVPKEPKPAKAAKAPAAQKEQKSLLKKAKNVRAEYRSGAHLRTAKIPAANSIADMIRKETGKTYTVYKDLFFKGIRPSIRDTLIGSGKKANIFSSRQNEAEEIIYGFLFEQYDNPYQNWEQSGEREQVEELGYAVPRIEPIISHWIKHRG